jgi:hypothetical protein
MIERAFYADFVLHLSASELKALKRSVRALRSIGIDTHDALDMLIPRLAELKEQRERFMRERRRAS